MSFFRILVIDDEPAICEFVRSLLAAAEVEVTSAASGAEGLERAHQLLPNLILLDVLMPGLDGLATCRLLRARPEFVATPIYMLTARVRSADHAASAKAGADGHIEKPFHGTELSDLVGRLRSRRA